jgi:DNA-binding transcriptional LysR family regulator
VASADLLGIATRRSVDAMADTLGMQRLAVTDAKWIRPVAVIYRKDGYLSPVAKRFVEILKATAKEIVAEQKADRRHNA